MSLEMASCIAVHGFLHKGNRRHCALNVQDHCNRVGCHPSLLLLDCRPIACTPADQMRQSLLVSPLPCRHGAGLQSSAMQAGRGCQCPRLQAGYKDLLPGISGKLSGSCAPGTTKEASPLQTSHAAGRQMQVRCAKLPRAHLNTFSWNRHPDRRFSLGAAWTWLSCPLICAAPLFSVGGFEASYPNWRMRIAASNR